MADYVYVASSLSGCLEIVNVTDPTNPIHAGRINHNDGGAKLINATGGFVVGNYAYVNAFGSHALEVVNVSNPVTPTHAGVINDGDGGAKLRGSLSVYILGNYAYVASYLENCLEIINISNPANPIHVGHIDDGVGGAKLKGPYDVFVKGNYAYVVSWISDCLEVIDVSNPAAPVHAGILNDGVGGAGLNGAWNIFIEGIYAYIVSSYSDCLEIVDITNPTNPLHKGRINNGDGGAGIDAPTGIFVDGIYAYITSQGTNCLEIVNVSNPALPVHIGRINDGVGGAGLEAAWGVFVRDNYAYVVSAVSNCLEIIDVSNPAVPVHAGRLNDGVGGAGLDRAHRIFAQSISFGNSLQFEDDQGNKLDIDLPVVPYKTIVEFPFDDQQLEDGSYTQYDHGDGTETYDIRKCQCTFQLPEDQATNFNSFFKTDTTKGRAYNVIMRMVPGGTFFPFGPDKGNEGNFTVAVIMQQHAIIKNEPYLYWEVKLLIVNTGSWPAYSLPTEVPEGNMTIGNIADNRFPPEWFISKGKYKYYATILQDSSAEWVDRYENADNYQTKFQMKCNESKAAKVVEYITKTSRINSFDLVVGENIFPFGEDLPDNKTYTVKMIQNKLNITNNGYNDFTFPLKLSYISFTG